jgi:hypothetical protein
MTDIAETKARLLAKYAKQAQEEHDKKNALDLTPIIDHLKKSLSGVEASIAREMKEHSQLTARAMKSIIRDQERKEQLEQLIRWTEKEQVSEMPKNIHILCVYLFPALYDYAAMYEPTTDCAVSPVYDAIGKVLCNWTGHTYYGDNR